MDGTSRLTKISRVFVVVLLAAASMIVSVWLAGRKHTATAMPECPPEPVIVLDPGHGGIDGGANVPGLLEKDIVLDIALRTQRLLEAENVKVVLTRNEDVDLGGPYDSGRLRRDLNYRIRVANQCSTVLMASIHVNSTRDTSERGVMIFYQVSRPGRDAAYLFDDVLRRWPVHDRKEQPHPRNGFAVLHWTKAPAILIELGFISNEQDRTLMVDPAYRAKVAQALASACSIVYRNWAK